MSVMPAGGHFFPGAAFIFSTHHQSALSSLSAVPTQAIKVKPASAPWVKLTAQYSPFASVQCHSQSGRLESGTTNESERKISNVL